MKRTLVLILAVGSIGLAACDDDPIVPVNEVLELAFTGLEPLANGYHYEGWAIINGAPVTTGKFNVDGSGNLVTTSGSLIAGGAFETGMDLEAATNIVITVEPAGDSDDVPADTHVLAGPIAGGVGTLTVGDGAALGNDFLAATGDFILATPTDGEMNNENSGIWFLSLASGSPAAGLSLPALPAGWAFEGWAVTGGQPVTTGRFTAVDMVDLAAPFSGAMAGPPFPGEDFLMNAPAGLILQRSTIITKEAILARTDPNVSSIILNDFFNIKPAPVVQQAKRLPQTIPTAQSCRQRVYKCCLHRDFGRR